MKPLKKHSIIWITALVIAALVVILLTVMYFRKDSGTAASKSKSGKETTDEASAQSTPESTITDSDSLTSAQTQFDQYISGKDYAKALDLLKNSFSNSKYPDSVISTYRNYVTYYESQGNYEASLNYQLDYFEKEYGLDNVVSDSTQYKLLQTTLQHISSKDSRIGKIQESVNRWNAIDELRKQKNYPEAERQLLKLKDEGLDCVRLYSYLGIIYEQQQKYKEVMDLYFSYIDHHSNYNTIESDFVASFEDAVAALHYAGKLTDEDIEPYIDRMRKQTD